MPFSMNTERIFVSSLVAARQRRTEAIAKVDTIRRIVEERTNQAKMTIENHRQSLMRRLDDYVRNIEHT